MHYLTQIIEHKSIIRAQTKFCPEEVIGLSEAGPINSAKKRLQCKYQAALETQPPQLKFLADLLHRHMSSYTVEGKK